MQSLICHVQKSFTTLEEAAAEKQMPVGSMDEFPLKPSHVHSLSNTTSAASPERGWKTRGFPLGVRKGRSQKQGQREGVWKKYKAKEGGKEQ